MRFILVVIFPNCCPHFYCVLVAASSGLPQVSLVYLGIKMIRSGKSFLCPDKQGTPEESQRIQQPKRCFNLPQ